MRRLIWVFFAVLPFIITEGLFAQYPSNQADVICLTNYFSYYSGDIPVVKNEVSGKALITNFLSNSHLTLNNQTNLIVWFHLILPENSFKSPALFFYNAHQYFEVYDDHGLIYRFGDIQPGKQVLSISLLSYIIKLNDIHSTNLYFRFYSLNKKLGIDGQIYFGEHADILKKILFEDLDNLIMGCFFILIGFIAFYIFFTPLSDKILLAFGLFAFSIGIFTLSRTFLKDVLFPSSEFWIYCFYFSLNLMAIGMDACAENITGAGPKKIGRRLVEIHIAYFIISTILLFLNLLSIYTATNIIMILLLVDIVFFATYAIYQTYKGNIEARILNIAGIVFALFGLNDILMNLFHFFPYASSNLHWGFFLFLICYSIVIIRRFWITYLSSISDGLTGVFNRRHFDVMVEIEWNRAKREKRPISLIIADVDFFKKFNDFNGHIAGDNCLKEISKAIKSIIKRAGDFVARYGGEEFVVLLPDTDVQGALVVANQIQDKIKKLKLPHHQSEISAYITLSLGVSTIIPANNSFLDLIQKADEALYKSKDSGRDTITVAG
ncbi:MAG: diguanylate cyclase [Brevinematales bacterium]|nr:diguanylate cyclase [Brevinematales bacterium]